jgi:endoglucanase
MDQCGLDKYIDVMKLLTAKVYHFRMALLISAVLLQGWVGFAAGRVVAVDHVGYTCAGPKYVFAVQAADSFAVINLSTGSVVFRSGIALWKSLDGATGRAVYRGDFSLLQATGSYRVVTSHGDSSSAFMISDSVYDAAFRKSLRGFYFQRCGMQLLPLYAGVYQHAACHMNDGMFHSSSDSAGQSHNALGGWHDAGDYGKYVVNAGISVGTLLLAYEMFPTRFSSDDLGIPESGNGVPDILDEARYELEWFLKMQRADGAFWFKLTRAQFEGFIMPQNDSGIRYIYQVSTTATGDAAAVLAKAARLFAPFNQTFALACLDAARRAWQYLADHQAIVPTGGFRNPSDTWTGEYGDTDDSDERLWASAELFETSGELPYNTYFLAQYVTGSKFSGAMWWGDVRPLALLTYLRSTQAAADADAKNTLHQALNTFCASQVAKRNDSGYHVVTAPGEYYWGSNSGALNSAVLLLAGFAETGDSMYEKVAADQLHYVFGTNGFARSFVTGLGENPPRQPHHRPSGSDGIAEPVPGLIVGGPNQFLSGDAVLDAVINSGTAPALCYADTVASYASNEIAINWNAPLVFVTGYFHNVSGPDAVGEQQMDLPSRSVLEQNYPNPFNPTTRIRFTIVNRQLTIVTVYDVLGRKVSTPVNEVKEPGRYTLEFDGSGLASGVYLYRLQAGEFVQTRKFVILR